MIIIPLNWSQKQMADDIGDTNNVVPPHHFRGLSEMFVRTPHRVEKSFYLEPATHPEKVLVRFVLVSFCSL